MHESERSRQRRHLVLRRQDDLGVAMAGRNLGRDAVQIFGPVGVVHVLTTGSDHLERRKVVVKPGGGDEKFRVFDSWYSGTPHRGTI